MKYPHHGTVLIKVIVQAKTPNGFLSGHIQHSKNKKFAVEADSKEECVAETESLLKALGEAYEQWLDKKKLDAQIVEQL